MKLYAITVIDDIGSVHELSVFDTEQAALDFEVVCSKQYADKFNEGWTVGFNYIELNSINESLRGITFTKNTPYEFE